MRAALAVCLCVCVWRGNAVSVCVCVWAFQHLRAPKMSDNTLARPPPSLTLLLPLARTYCYCYCESSCLLINNLKFISYLCVAFLCSAARFTSHNRSIFVAHKLNSQAKNVHKETQARLEIYVRTHLRK